MTFYKKAFTLVELLLVIAIIGILTTIIIVGLSESRKKGHDSERISDMNTVASALATYYSQNHKYPSSADTPPITSYTDLTTMLQSGNYISSTPEDPQNVDKYIYYYDSSGATYTLGACLETTSGGTGDPMNLGCPVATYQLNNGEPA